MLTSALPTGLATLASAVVVAGLAVASAGGTAAPAPAAAPGARWVWPVDPPRVVRGFDDVGRYAAGHRGVDLTAAVGAPVLAVSGGSVTFAGPVAGRGVIVVLHPDGLRTTYEPVQPDVAAGDAVAAGDRLGTLSRPRHCTTDCLHLGLRDGDRYLDPLGRLRAAAPLLLPLGRA